MVALGSPQGGATVDTAAWGEASSDTSSDGEESGLADFAANVAGRSSSGVRCLLVSTCLPRMRGQATVVHANMLQCLRPFMTA